MARTLLGPQHELIIIYDAAELRGHPARKHRAKSADEDEGEVCPTCGRLIEEEEEEELIEEEGNR